MRHIFFNLLLNILIMFSTISFYIECQTRSSLKINIIHNKSQISWRKRPKNKPKPSIQNNDESQAESELHYQPNPVILAGVGQIMNGALSIAQDPHSRPNVGHSVASMVHGIITIIIEKLARRKINISNWQNLAECYNRICADVNQEIFKHMET